MRIATKWYCKKDGWTTGPICPECENKTEKKVLPARRGGFYYLKDIEYPLPSVTNVLSVIAKPALIPWAAKKSAEAALKDPNITVEEAARSIYGESKRATNRGTNVHDLIATGKYEKDKLDESILPYIKAYEDWFDAFPHEVLLSEKIVYTDSWAGKFDALVRDKNNKLWLLDYKTNKSGLFPETGLQLSAYAHAQFYEEEYGEGGKPFNLKIDFLAGINFRPDGTYLIQKYRDDYAVFEHVLALFKWSEQ